MKVMMKTTEYGLYYLAIMVVIFRKHQHGTWFHNVTVLGKRLSNWKVFLTKGTGKGIQLNGFRKSDLECKLMKEWYLSCAFSTEIATD